MPVHLYGQPADMDPILDIARRRGLLVIEDAAQAHGAEYQGRRCGSMGDMAGFSFYPGKNLGAYGEGGALTTNDPAIARKVRLLRNWGEERRYEHAIKAYNYRMDGIQGAVLRVKLRHLETWTEAAPRACDGLPAAPCRAPALERRRNGRIAATCTTSSPCGCGSGMRARDQLQAAGIHTGVHYPIPVHLQPAYQRSRIPRRRLSRVRSGGARSAVAADVSRNSRRRSSRRVCAWRSGPRRRRPPSHDRGLARSFRPSTDGARSSAIRPPSSSWPQTSDSVTTRRRCANSTVITCTARATATP